MTRADIAELFDGLDGRDRYRDALEQWGAWRCEQIRSPEAQAARRRYARSSRAKELRRRQRIAQKARWEAICGTAAERAAERRRENEAWERARKAEIAARREAHEIRKLRAAYATVAHFEDRARQDARVAAMVAACREMR